MVGKITAAERTAFQELLYLDAVRGWDSTGVFNVKPDGSTRMFKQASVPTEFLQRTQAQRVLSETGIMALVGHNRAATKGLVNDDNAHPFQHDAIIGVHNGTLRTTHQLPNSAKFVVDSDNLYYAMSQEGIDTLIPKVNGAYALVWHDAREAGAVYVLRNSERPLWYAHSKDKATCFIASEYPMIGMATDNTRAKVELATDPKGYKFFNFKTMTLYRIGADAVVEEVRTLTEYTPPVTTYNSRSDYGDYYNPYTRQNNRQTQEKALLDASGLKERQRVLCKFDQFELYNANVPTSGKLYGTTLTEGVNVVCFGHDYKDAMAISKDGFFEATVTGIGLWQNENADLKDPKSITVSVKDARSCGDTMVTAVLIENGKVIEEDIFFVKALPDASTPSATGAYWIASDTLKVGDTYPPKSNVLALVV